MTLEKRGKRGTAASMLGGRGRPSPGRLLVAVLAASACVAASAGVAVAVHDAKSRGIVKVKRSDRGATRLARQIFEGNRRNLIRAKFVTTPPGGAPVAISAQRLSGFPRRGRSFAILSTGCALLADNPDKSESTGCRDGGLKIRGARDVTIWRLRIRVPKRANCLSFRFRFLSEEYPEFAGSIFNDAFIAELSRAPKWNASGKVDPTIRAPRDFATTRDGKLISVNGTGVARVTGRAAHGTTYDAATGKLRAATRVRPGVHLLHLSLFDQGDRQYDSAVFIDRLLVHKAKHCRSGVVATK